MAESSETWARRDVAWQSPSPCLSHIYGACGGVIARSCSRVPCNARVICTHKSGAPLSLPLWAMPASRVSSGGTRRRASSARRQAPTSGGDAGDVAPAVRENGRSTANGHDAVHEGAQAAASGRSRGRRAGSASNLKMARRRGATPDGGASTRVDAGDPAATSKPSLASKGGTTTVWEDAWNIALLLVLYMLQGIPMGLAGSIPFMLQQNGASMTEQALFAYASMPYAVKLLWAPIVDALYTSWGHLGRRKSWVVPVQLLVGTVMILAAPTVMHFLGEGPTAAAAGGDASELDGDSSEGAPSGPRVLPLTILFLCLYFMVATQDIAVDGWALTILHRDNVGWASTCNTVGLTFGYMLSYTVFLALNDVDFCNSYLRPMLGWDQSEAPSVTLGSYMVAWGWVYLVVTLFVWLLKDESDVTQYADGTTGGADSHANRAAADAAPAAAAAAEDAAEAGRANGAAAASTDAAATIDDDSLDASDSETPSSLRESYTDMWKIVKHPGVQSLCLVLLTCRIGYVATDAATGLEFSEIGVPKQHMAVISVIYLPVEVLLPFVISKFTSGPRPMTLWIYAYPVRLMLGLVYAVVTAIAPEPETLDAVPPMWYYVLAISVGVLHRMTSITMFVAQMAFSARIADPAIGGTYMTLLNTAANFGWTWLASPIMVLMDWTDTYACYVAGARVEGAWCDKASADAVTTAALAAASGADAAGAAAAEDAVGSGDGIDPGVVDTCPALVGDDSAQCVKYTDGYETTVLICTAMGVIWLSYFWKRVRALERVPVHSWHVTAPQPGSHSA